MEVSQLRQAIINALPTSIDRDAVSIKVCAAIERQLDLLGNGWWDGDKAVLKEIRGK